MMRFLPSEELHPLVDEVFLKEKFRIQQAAPGAAVYHVGATSVAGAITRGDVDIAVRMDARAFAPVVRAMRGLYRPHQLQNWTSTFASFVREDTIPMPVGIQITVTGSPEDTFVLFRDLLRQDRALLARYNALKEQCLGCTPDEYRTRKVEFFRDIQALLENRT